MIRQNCFFFASLFTSLIAAAGAVLAKQWLANYQRTGQTGPLDEQGLRRTEKYIGAEKWRLRAVVETLPTLILISLGLFFVAIVDYVWTINEEVAILITIFSAIATFLYITMLLTAAIFSDCPFQTAPSALLVKSGHLITALSQLTALGAILMIKLLGYTLLLPVTSFLHAIDQGFKTPRDILDDMRNQVAQDLALARSVGPSHPRTRTPKDQQILYAESATSMLDISPRDDVVMSIATNIPAITKLSSVRGLAKGTVLRSLTSRFFRRIDLLRFGEPVSNLVDMCILAHAIVSILAANSLPHRQHILSPMTEIIERNLPTLPSEPQVLLIAMCYHCGIDSMREYFPFGRLKAFTRRTFPTSGSVSAMACVALLHAVGVAHQLLPAEAIQGEDRLRSEDALETLNTILADRSIPSVAPVLSLASRQFCNEISKTLRRPSHGAQRIRAPDQEACIRDAWDLRSG